jgi:glutamine amidotransferase
MSVVVVDYDSGNRRAAEMVCARAAHDRGLKLEVKISGRAEDVRRASHIVLPGQGAFGDCKSGLAAVPGMIAALEEAVIKEGRPFLGICVGMQLMAERGHEHGVHQGLGWLPGDVVAMTPADRSLKIPHMGWNELFDLAPHPVLKGLQPGCHVYFVHSYIMRCAERRHVLASCDYGGPFAAIVGRDNMVGTQFHVEKSQATGLAIIGNFLEWRP